jgi:hypothetical protein
LLEQIRQGIEEENMPSREIVRAGSSAELAIYAAQASLLGVGVGLDAEGVITLTHYQMPADQFVLQVPASGDLETARIMGNNAARLYKRYPFLDWKNKRTSGGNAAN